VRQLVAWLNDSSVGVITEENDIWSFEYDEAWMTSPDGFDLAPALPRTDRRHRDGSTSRPVQWYLDNLLPEEKLRETLVKSAQLKGDDAFSLLAYLGAESAGSLVLLPPGEPPSREGGLKPLPDAELCGRIRNMERVPLSEGAPKRMSLAGAQNKLAVVFKEGQLFEPVGHEPSTHILKPNHPSEDYPGSVINEYVTMKLADGLGLPVPAVHRLYTPEPVYLVERFDRWQDPQGRTHRTHIIDTCQLLNKGRSFKQSSATVEALADAANACDNKLATRVRVFAWLLFCVLVANDDNHLKNLSYRIGPQGIALAPHYDLLSTGTYHTRALADDRGAWPSVRMMYALGRAEVFGQVTMEHLRMAAEALGLPQAVCSRIVMQMTNRILTALDALIESVAAENGRSASRVDPVFAAQEDRVLRSMRHIVVPHMVNRVRQD